jgi:hypothetical protein
VYQAGIEPLNLAAAHRNTDLIDECPMPNGRLCDFCQSERDVIPDFSQPTVMRRVKAEARASRQTPSPTDTPERGADLLYETSFHEAGHAVVAEVLGIRVTGITASTTSGLSYTWTRPLPRQSTSRRGHQVNARIRRLVENHLLISVAGGMAEKLLSPASQNCHDYADYADAVELADIVFPECPQARDLYIEALREYVKVLLRSEWHLVDALALALRQRRAMNGEEVRAIIQAAIRQAEKDVEVADQARIAEWRESQRRQAARGTPAPGDAVRRTLHGQSR